MPRMTLTVKDRLMLSNQLRILEALCPDEAESYATARKVFEEGYALAYDWYAELICDEMSEECCREVMDILDMFRALTISYARLNDKTGIDAYDLQFHGFDGNNEGKQLGFAEFLINDQKKWDELKPEGGDLNSHMPTLERYRRMLAAWRPLQKNFPLSKDQIQAIVAERIHPSKR